VREQRSAAQLVGEHRWESVAPWVGEDNALVGERWERLMREERDEDIAP